MRAVIGLTGQFAAVDGLLTGAENLTLMADLHHLGRAEGRRRVAELLERFDLVDAAAKPLATYSGGMRRRLDLAMTLVGSAPDHLPRRADHRARPPQPPHHVGDHPRARRRRRHDLPDHAVPRRGGPPRRSDRDPRPRPAHRRGHLGRAQAPRPRRPHPPAVRRRGRVCDAADRALVGSHRDDEALSLQVPSDGGVASLRSVLDRLDRGVDRGRRAVDPHPRPRRRLLRPHQPRHPPRRPPDDRPLTHTVQRLGARCSGATCATSCATRR